jgi:squalene synthase HpnC
VSIDHYENFPVASWLCPPRLRPAIASIYHFARTADDLADEGNDAPDERLHSLALFRGDLDIAASGSGASTSGRWPGLFERLAMTIRSHDLPTALLVDLLSAFEQDVVKHRYANKGELLDYCSRSANPVGRLLLHLYEVGDEVSLRQSDAICTALQLINFWQDLSVDCARDRLYVPSDDAAAHEVAIDDLLQRRDGPAVHALVAELCSWARGLMLEGSPLVHRVAGRAGWELRLVVQGGLRILDRIDSLGYATLTQRPTLDKLDLPVMLTRAIVMRRRPTRLSQATA